MTILKVNVFCLCILKGYVLLCLNTSCFEGLHVEESVYVNCVNRCISKYSLHSFDRTNICICASSRPLLDAQIALLRDQSKLYKVELINWRTWK